MSDTREDPAAHPGEGDPAASRRRGDRHPPRATTDLGWRVVKIVLPLATGAFLFLLLTVYMSLRA